MPAASRRRWGDDWHLVEVPGEGPHLVGLQQGIPLGVSAPVLVVEGGGPLRRLRPEDSPEVPKRLEALRRPVVSLSAACAVTAEGASLPRERVCLLTVGEGDR